MKGIVSALLVVGLSATALPGLAQGRSNDPNLGHFYMARQQIQILDDAPVIYDKRTVPGAAQQVALPQGPAPLPRASFQGYSSSVPSMGQGLPEVVNGVPRKMPPPTFGGGVNPRMGKAGAYKAKAAPPKPKGPVTAKTYAPYKGYGGGNVQPTTITQYGTTGNSGNANSSTAVQGSLLHWSRTRRGGY